MEIAGRADADACQVNIAVQVRVKMRPKLMPLVYIGDELAPMVAP